MSSQPATKFTPGPWVAIGPPHNIHIVEGAREYIRICFLASDGPTEANARLIAAAPDMLAALQVYAAWADPDHCNAPDLKLIRDQIRTAIAKATQE